MAQLEEVNLSKFCRQNQTFLFNFSVSLFKFLILFFFFITYFQFLAHVMRDWALSRRCVGSPILFHLPILPCHIPPSPTPPPTTPQSPKIRINYTVDAWSLPFLPFSTTLAHWELRWKQPQVMYSFHRTTTLFNFRNTVVIVKSTVSCYFCLPKIDYLLIHS